MGDVILESWTQTNWQSQSVAELLDEAQQHAGVLRALVLMRVRFGQALLAPAPDEPLRAGDLILLAGCHRSRRVMRSNRRYSASAIAQRPAGFWPRHNWEHVAST